MTRRRTLIVATLALVLLLATVLRFRDITAQSLWNDEGTSAALAVRDLATITRDAGLDIHPPLYYWLLHFWVGALGNGELALRSLSALLGIAAVLLAGLLGARLFGAEVGLIAALLAAISPYLVYYSQETRMYMLLAAVGAAGTWALVRLMEEEAKARTEGRETTQRTAWWAAALVLITAAGLYTHYSFPVLWAVWNVAYVAWLVATRRQGRPWVRLARWAALQAAALLLYAPWLPTALRQMRQWPAISEAHSLTYYLKDALRLFTAGETLEVSGIARVAIAFLGLVALVGLLPRPGEPRRLPGWLRTGLAGACCLIPVIAPWVLSLWKPAYRPKFVLIAAPAFALLLGRGVLFGRAALARFRWGRAAGTIWGVVGVLVAGAVAAASLSQYESNPRYARDDYRGIAAAITARGRAGDAILVNAPSQVETFGYYYKGPLPVYPLPRQRPLDRVATEADLQRMVQGARQVFAVFWATDESDPERFIEGWMDAHTFKAQDTWYGNVRLVVYAVPQAEGALRPLGLQLGTNIALEAYSIAGGPARPGDILQLTLHWKALGPISERYKVFVHLLNAAGRVVAQNDAEPGGGARLTTTWQPGDEIADNHGLAVPLDAPAGEYRIEIGMYGAESGVRLPITRDGESVGDHWILEPVEIAASAGGVPVAQRPAPAVAIVGGR